VAVVIENAKNGQMKPIMCIIINNMTHRTNPKRSQNGAKNPFRFDVPQKTKPIVVNLDVVSMSVYTVVVNTDSVKLNLLSKRASHDPTTNWSLSVFDFRLP